MARPRIQDLHEAVQSRPLEVVPRPGEDVERMIKRFTRKVREDGVMFELRERRGYRKPSEKRRRKISRRKSGNS